MTIKQGQFSELSDPSGYLCMTETNGNRVGRKVYAGTPYLSNSGLSQQHELDAATRLGSVGAR